MRVSGKRRVASQRRLLLEGLERRELMAADTAPVFYNPLIPTDVNGDFNVTPIDALMVINALNLQSTTGQQIGNGVSTVATKDSFNHMIDVNGDGNATALDALMVINQLNQGEGEPTILVGVQTQILSSTGVVQTPDVNGNYTLSAGEQFTLRVQGQDRRITPPPNQAQGIFNFYIDVDYSTVGNPDKELAEVLWGESQQLRFSDNLRGGTFTLNFAGASTGPITAVQDSFGFLNASATSANIRTAVGALAFSGGVSNVEVTSFVVTGERVFQIRYINAERRINQPDPVFTTAGTSLLSSNASPVTTAVSTSIDPSRGNVFSPAVAYPLNPVNSGLPVAYSNAPSGFLQATPGVGYSLEDIGGFSTTFLPDFAGADGPRTLVNIFDTAFRGSGSDTGAVQFSFDVSGATGKDILLLGGQAAAIPKENIAFPAPFQVRFVQNIQANPASATVNEDSGSNNIPVTATLIRGTSFRVVDVSDPPANVGVVSFPPNTPNPPNSSTVVFTPAANYFGPATFTYTVENNLGDRSTATVTVSVTARNDAPTILPGLSFSVGEDATTPLVITPSQIFSPGPLESTQIVALGVPALAAGQTGASITRNAAGNISIVPAPNYFGPVVFTVVGTDNGTNPANLFTTATVTVNVTAVNDKPESNVRTYTVAEDPTAPLSILASQLFRPGPSGVGAETTQTVVLTNVTAITAATAGTISLGTGGTSAVFNPASNFFGQFFFTAVARDNGIPAESSDPTTFTINITAVNDPPTAVADTGAAGFTISNVPGVVQQLDVMRNDSAGPGETTDTIQIVALGALTGTGASTSSISISTDGRRVLYTPGSGLFNVSQTFTYTIEDSGGLRSTATASVFIAPPVLPFAVADSLTLAEGAGATPIDVLVNDLVNTGATKRLISFTQPVLASAGTVVLLDNGTPTNLGDDRLSFTPSANFSGSTSFTYRMVDSATGSQESVGTVNITVNDVNDAPTLVNQSVNNGVEDTPLTIPSSVLLAGSSAGPNETNQTLTITNAVVTTPNAGTATVVGGNVVYTPARDFNGQVLVTFTATDSGTPALTDSAILTITVAARNDAPIAVGSSATTAEGVPLTIVGSNVVINDRPGPATALDELREQDVVLTGVSLATASAGTVSLVSGNVIFTPANFFNGDVVIGYTVADTASPALTAQGQLRVRVTEVNNSPVPVNAARNGFASLPTTVNLTSELASASRGAPNESAQTLRITRAIRNANTVGTVVLNTDGTISYTAPTGFSGADSFSYEVRDNGITNGVADPKTAIATVTMNIAPFQPSVVKGTVWVDDDKDGTIDRDEQLLAGVEVRLTGRSIGATSDITPRVVRTLATGNYSFEQLPPGTYTVSYVTPMALRDGSGPNTITKTIVAPGGASVAANFSTEGIDLRQFSTQNGNAALGIENLNTSYYGTFPNIKAKGVFGVVQANGVSAWTSRRDGNNGDFASSVFMEIVLADDKRTAFLTTVDFAGVVRTAVVSRQYLAVSDDMQGNSLVYVLARASELNFVPVGNSNGANGSPRVSARGYLQSIDQALADFDF